MASPQDLSYDLEWDAVAPPSYNRTVANKAQLSVLETLHQRSLGRATKDDILRASDQTGLEVKWIRKWLSRRRCRDKSRTSSASEVSLSDSSYLDPGRSSTSSILPHFDYLLSTTAPGSAPARPAYMRAISAPTLLTTPAYSHYERPPLFTRASGSPQTPYDRPATAPHLLSCSSAGFALPPPMDTTLAPQAHAVSPSLPAGSVLSVGTLPRREYPPYDMSSASDDLEQTRLSFEAQGALQHAFFAGYESRDLSLTPMQADMLSALGLELDAAPSSDAFAALREDVLEQRVPVPVQPCPVFFRVRLADLGTLAPGNREYAATADGVREARHDSLSPVPELAPAENATPFSEPDQYVVVEAEEDDEDEVPTPTHEDKSFDLQQPAPRKVSPAPLDDFEGIVIV